MLSGVMMSCMPSGQKSKGIQKERVLPDPVPEMHTMSLSPRKRPCATSHCQRHGLHWNTSSVFCLISAMLGMLQAVVVGGR